MVACASGKASGCVDRACWKIGPTLADILSAPGQGAAVKAPGPKPPSRYAWLLQIPLGSLSMKFSKPPLFTKSTNCCVTPVQAAEKVEVELAMTIHRQS